MATGLKRQRGRGAASKARIARRAAFLGAGVLTVALVAASPARAQGFFDFLFGGPQAPALQAGPVAYSFAVSAGGNSEVEGIVRRSSELEELRAQAAPDPDSLVRRAELDLPKLQEALFAAGYYNARVSIRIAGTAIEIGQRDLSRAISASTAATRAGPVPVVAEIAPGPLFSLRAIEIVEARTGRRLAYPELPHRAIAIAPGAPARASDVRAAETRLIEHFRAIGHALAKPTDLAATVDHRQAAMDVRIEVDPGPVTPAGPIRITGAPNIDHAVIASYIYMKPGEIYTTDALQHLRKSIARIEAVSSVKVTEGKALDANGQLPLEVEVSERPMRAAGLSARFSSVDGPAGRAFFEHRNLFGGAERLRLSTDLGYYTGGSRGFRGFSSNAGENVVGRTALSFIKPALWGSRNDLLFDAVVERERTRGYDSDLGRLTAGIRHRVDHTLWFSGAVEFEHGKVRDTFGRRRYNLVALPLTANYDTTDNLLDPTRGFRLQATVTPFVSAFGGTFTALQTRIQGSTYYALDEDARYVLAARLGFGSTSGASLAELPATRRFYAGGGGSVRGFSYKSLSPKDIYGTPIGGLSLFEGSLEARIKLTEQFGLVPFVDVGGAYNSAFPDFSNKLRVGAGLGLRYFTPIGPIRLDVATPLDRQRGEKPVGVYVSIGQAF